MSKMTDKEIIKALECCGKNVLYENCGDCPYEKDFGKDHICTIKVAKDALDLINRQQAEIEKLTINMNAFGLGMKREKERADTIRAEAIKELEAKIHEKLHQAEMHGNFEPVVTREMFDSVVKEVVGEGK